MLGMGSKTTASDGFSGQEIVWKKHRRMVVFAGPHKSASSSVQELFMKLASSRLPPDKRHPSLVNWTWPWNPRRRSYLPRKGFAPLVTESGDGFHQLIWGTISEVWHGNLNVSTPTSVITNMGEDTNLIWGTEELDRFGSTPWSGRNGIDAIKAVQHHVKDPTIQSPLEIVVNYRRPRKDQWISIWKQLTRTQKSASSYSDFLCDTNEYIRIWEYIDCVANPLGLVHALLEVKEYENIAWKVHLLDMKGIAEQGQDVGHVLACEVLQVPCKKTNWLPGTDERPIVQNAKSGNPDLTEEALKDLEWVLRQRDCAYMQSLEAARDDGSLIVHHGDALWEDCENVHSARHGNKNYISKLFSNSSFLLDLIQSQVGCSGGGSVPNNISGWRKRMSSEFPTAGTPDERTMPPSNRTRHVSFANRGPPLSAELSEVDPLMQAAQGQLLITQLLLLLLVGFIARNLRIRRSSFA